MNPRPLNLVMDAVVKLIPYDFQSREDIVDSFNNIKDSINYTAPEAMYLRWEDFIETLSIYIPNPTTAWQKKIQGLVNAEIDYREVLNA